MRSIAAVRLPRRACASARISFISSGRYSGNGSFGSTYFLKSYIVESGVPLKVAAVVISQYAGRLSPGSAAATQLAKPPTYASENARFCIGFTVGEGYVSVDNTVGL